MRFCTSVSLNFEANVRVQELEGKRFSVREITEDKLQSSGLCWCAVQIDLP
jgi:hypothetical protein